ncbi:hypothetical protein F511_16939 [Dorcoceras hygrometricum]|uniref:Uncharacterized protein n=1 Tax=Dorcoceras hygrometricum TaxID=472368 RepID=A0A2Z7C7N5_9LAMI|nr:hypothetical protein F511_16939 [Dorcoceras hygrometricum]
MFWSVTLLASRRLVPTSFTGKLALQLLAAVDLLIRSTTGNRTPLSACTRRPEEFPRTNLLVYVIETSPITDTASRGPITIANPKSQFRTDPSDHGKAPSNIAP